MNDGSGRYAARQRTARPTRYPAVLTLLFDCRCAICSRLPGTFASTSACWRGRITHRGELLANAKNRSRSVSSGNPIDSRSVRHSSRWPRRALAAHRRLRFNLVDRRADRRHGRRHALYPQRHPPTLCGNENHVPHLGGLLPMTLERLDQTVAWEAPNTPEPPSRAALRMWYDTVGHDQVPALQAAAATFGTERLLFGTDFRSSRANCFKPRWTTSGARDCRRKT